MTRRIALFATVAIFGLAACGNDSPTSATTPGTDAAAATTPVESTVVDETVAEETGTTVAGGADGAGTEFCDKNVDVAEFQPFCRSSTRLPSGSSMMATRTPGRTVTMGVTMV